VRPFGKLPRLQLLISPSRFGKDRYLNFRKAFRRFPKTLPDLLSKQYALGSRKRKRLARDLSEFNRHENLQAAEQENWTASPL
jgi:hypothetical protein